MNVAIITGAAGLIGAEAAQHFLKQGFTVAGIDNDMRAKFFGPEASTAHAAAFLKRHYDDYHHYNEDIRSAEAVDDIFEEYGTDIRLVIHTAAQPSHDWAARDPRTDFGVNATGTLNLLEATRKTCPDAPFIFTSTNKVYGDRPNTLPLVELESRWDIDRNHAFAEGITEEMSVDNCLHSVFGASKVAADIMVQEYGRYFDMKTVCFRGGCLTGPGHQAAELHGFLAYLMKCCVTGTEYQIFGYKGKQVRDNIHSFDLIQAFDAFYRAPRVAEVYNIGGGRFSNVSMQEAIASCEDIAGKKMNTVYREENRIGDHIWWISGIQKFQEHYPDWKLTYSTHKILEEVYKANIENG